MQSKSKYANYVKRAAWVARIAFCIVFVVNIQCALQFIINPYAFIGAYELTGDVGAIALAGLGVVFLMWNATYPLFIVRPDRYPVLGGVILAQQIIGLLGESYILATIPADHVTLAASIQRFISFDAFGLVIMAATYAALLHFLRYANQ